MNTFNMKQWLTENKVGPYAKTAINESHEGNDAWLDHFYDLLDSPKVDKFIRNQIHQIPSSDIISMYSNETPEQAASHLIKKMQHGANESATMSEASGREIGGNGRVTDADFIIDGVEYLVSYVYDWTGKYYSEDNDIDNVVVTVKVEDLAKEGETDYIPVADESEKKEIENYLNTNQAAQRELVGYVDFSEGEFGYNESEHNYLDEETKDEQIGVGYVMKTKPSIDHDY